jgi:lantibiotic modifying enzyme
MDASGRALDWIGSVAVEVAGGLAWLEDGELFDDLYAGTAGVLLGCAEAEAAGLDTGRVSGGARGRLLHLVEQGPDAMSDDGMFSGWAGVALALRAWARVTADEEAAGAAARVTRRIGERVLREPVDPERYTDIISGDAGTLLALVADGLDSEAAHVLADRLVAVAEPGADGPQWRMVAGRERLMPGFSHGTAGVAYALGVAGRALGRPDLIDVAMQGAGTLLAIGDHPEGWAVPLTIPPQPDRPAVNFGWCHGPTGTVRLFLLLNEIDPQPRWPRAIDAGLRAVRDSRVPARLYPGYWDNLARCCGTAGVGQLLLDRYRDTGDTSLLDWVDTLIADVMQRTVTTPHGIAWSNTEHTADPPQLPPEPGFMQGAAGIFGWLARRHTLPLASVDPPWL